MENTHAEVIIIGSGFGAAAPALRLARAGFQVLVLERGAEIVPARDFRQSQDPKYLLRYIKTVRGDNVNFTYGEGLGGGSGFYESVSLRAPSIAFEQKSAEGHRLWPSGFTRASMDPYYETAERMMHVSQIGRDEIPKTGLAFSLLMKRLGYSVDRVPYSIRGCTGRAFCVAGCTQGAKVTVLETYLDPARRAGATIMTDIEALEIVPLPVSETSESPLRRISEIPFRYLIRCRDRKTGGIRLFKAKILILGGGTVGTARLLLGSRRELPRLSSHVGKNIAVNGTVKSLGILPEGFIEGDMFTGRSHPGVISYEFLISRGITLSTAKPLPVDAVSYANIVLEGDTRPNAWWGAPKVELMKLYRRRALVLYALGLTTPTAELRCDRNGNVVPRFSLDGQFREYFESTRELLHSIFVRNGAQVVSIRIIDGQGSEYKDHHITTAHMTGSCRMGDSADRGVVDATGEVFNYPGLYISDGAAIPSSLAVNPYLTILANAERVADFLVSWYTRGDARIPERHLHRQLHRS